MTIFDDIGRGFQQFGKDVEKGFNQVFKPPTAHQVQQTNKFFNDLAVSLQPKNVLHEINNQIVKPIIYEVGDTQRTIVHETGKTASQIVYEAAPIAKGVGDAVGSALGGAVNGAAKGLGVDPKILYIGGVVVGGILLISFIRK